MMLEFFGADMNMMLNISRNEAQKFQDKCLQFFRSQPPISTCPALLRSTSSPYQPAVTKIPLLPTKPRRLVVQRQQTFNQINSSLFLSVR
ncbi:hypothetical protein L6452_19706 [Arctium lappa]|uniref:Uncharacterized protein n=1 Tax=Arctium lappa TaxID=4217 RepID=A0ACB9B8L0_ARCLA|nr:hypothetical protein L6452_19706 [Arctium lappa]